MENDTAINTYFITLTYNDTNIPRDGKYTVLHKPHPVNFIRKLKKLEAKTPQPLPQKIINGKPRKLRYFLVGEYGSKSYRPHYHLIIWNCSDYTMKRASRAWTNSQGQTMGFVQAELPRGQNAVATYVAKYVMKEHANIQFKVPPFKSQSNSIGLEHALRFPGIIKNGMIRRGKYQIPMPKHWIPKFYSEDEWEGVKDYCAQKQQENKTEYYNQYFKNLESDIHDTEYRKIKHFNQHVEEQQLNNLLHQERITKKQSINQY